jgi:hypothetical protein
MLNAARSAQLGEQMPRFGHLLKTLLRDALALHRGQMPQMLKAIVA